MSKIQQYLKSFKQKQGYENRGNSPESKASNLTNNSPESLETNNSTNYQLKTHKLKGIIQSGVLVKFADGSVGIVTGCTGLLLFAKDQDNQKYTIPLGQFHFDYQVTGEVVFIDGDKQQYLTSGNREKIERMSYKLITEKNQIEAMIRNLYHDQIIVAIDTETTGLDPHTSKLRLISLTIENHAQSYLIDCYCLTDEDLQPLQNWLNNSVKVVIAHNFKFDLQFLWSRGINLSGPKLFDTLIASYLVEGGKPRNSLVEVCNRYLQLRLDKTEQKSNWSGELSEEQLNYAVLDSSVLIQLRKILIDKLKDKNLIRIAAIEFDCVWATAQMEYNGIAILLQKWKQLDIQTQTSMKARKAECERFWIIKTEMGLEVPINLNSNQQIVKALKTRGVKLIESKDDKGKITFCVDADALAKYATNYPKLQAAILALIEYKNLAKLCATTSKLEKFLNLVTGRIHPFFNQAGTESGRYSCSNPNLQQLPRSVNVRCCIVPEPGFKFVISDFSQIELRIGAAIANEPTMIQAYAQGADLHKLTASLVLGKPIEAVTKADRQIAKSLNFGLLYGMGHKSLQQYALSNYGVQLTEAEAKDFRDKFFTAYTGLKTWHELTKRRLNQPIDVRTKSDRYRCIPSQSYTQRLNTPVQGTGADILKLALGKLYKRFHGTEVKLIACIHDEIILESPEAIADSTAAILTQIMEAAGREFITNVPIIAEAKVCDSWAQK